MSRNYKFHNREGSVERTTRKDSCGSGGWWKISDIYTKNESINLSIFKQKLKEGLSPEKAVFETPTGKILKANNFDGTVEVIKNTSDEVIIYFNSKL